MSRRSARRGKVVDYPAGTFLTRPGDPADRFTWVESGEIEVVNPFTDERHVAIDARSRRSSWAKSAFLNGGSVSMAMRAAVDTRVIEVPRDAMLTLMSQIPEMSDIIITVLAARRRRQLEAGDSEPRHHRRGRGPQPARRCRLRQPQPHSLYLAGAGQPGSRRHRQRLPPAAGHPGADLRPRHGRHRPQPRKGRPAARAQPRPAGRRGV